MYRTFGSLLSNSFELFWLVPFLRIFLYNNGFPFLNYSVFVNSNGYNFITRFKLLKLSFYSIQLYDTLWSDILCFTIVPTGPVIDPSHQDSHCVTQTTRLLTWVHEHTHSLKKKGELRLWKCHTMAWHFNFMELHFAQKNGMFFFFACQAMVWHFNFMELQFTKVFPSIAMTVQNVFFCLLPYMYMHKHLEQFRNWKFWSCTCHVCIKKMIG